VNQLAIVIIIIIIIHESLLLQTNNRPSKKLNDYEGDLRIEQEKTQKKQYTQTINKNKETNTIISTSNKQYHQ